MSDSFDPYHVWLGIPPQSRPPTHYELLGISPNEHEKAVIEAAFMHKTEGSDQPPSAARSSPADMSRGAPESDG